MPFQRVDAELDEVQLARRKALLETLPINIASRTWSETRQRYGIINMEVEGRKFWPHQLLAMQRLLMMDHEKDWDEQDVAMVFSHDPGLGKTIMTVAIMGGLWQYVPTTDAFKALLIVPTNVAEKWYTTILSWSTFTKDDVFYPLHESDITYEKLQGCKVLVLTPAICMMAYKTFMWEDPKGETWTAKNGNPQQRARLVRGYDPADEVKRAKDGDQLPPLHPLFAFNQANPKVWSMAAVDEAHEYTSLKKTHLHSAAIRDLLHNATYRFGLTGTPVQHKVEEMPGICRLLNVPDPWMHEKRYWSVKGGGSDTLRASTSLTFFDGFVDRVAKEMVQDALVDERTHRLEFDPWVGLLPNGTYVDDAIAVHNAYYNRADLEQQANDAPNAQQKRTDNMWRAWHRMAHFAFDATLGMHSSADFHADKSLYEHALRNPSQYVHLLHRIVRSRQMAGHQRIAIFSESVVELNIALNFLDQQGNCGKMVLFDGTVPQIKRQKMLLDFLSDDITPKGVLAFSKAGSHAVDICPGCEVMIIIGDFPWSPAILDQAKARIRRVSVQTKPVEYIEMIPRRGIMAAKVATYDDKSLRLVLGCRDANFSEYKEHARNQVFLRGKLTIAMAPVDPNGNYQTTKEMEEARERYEQLRDAAEADGLEFNGSLPSICEMPDPKLFQDVEVPEVAWPIDGYEEQQQKEEVNHQDDLSRAARKRARDVSEERSKRVEAQQQRLRDMRNAIMLESSDEEP